MSEEQKTPQQLAPEIAEALGLDAGKITPTDYGRGRSGISWHIWGPDNRLAATVYLAPRDDGTHRLYAEVPVWVQDKLRGLGIVLEPAPKVKPEEQPEAGIQLHNPGE